MTSVQIYCIVIQVQEVEQAQEVVAEAVEDAQQVVITTGHRAVRMV